MVIFDSDSLLQKDQLKKEKYKISETKAVSHRMFVLSLFFLLCHDAKHYLSAILLGDELLCFGRNPASFQSVQGYRVGFDNFLLSFLLVFCAFSSPHGIAPT